MAKASNAAFEADFTKVPDFSRFYTDFNKAAADFGKLFVNGKAPIFDVEAAIASQRKNVEALTVANQVAFEGAQTVLRREVEIVRDAVEGLTNVAKEIAAAGSFEEKLAKQAEIAKSSFETALANFRELSGLVQKTSDQAVSVISKRVVDNLDEVKSAMAAKTNGKK
jgi:phasin family protein